MRDGHVRRSQLKEEQQVGRGTARGDRWGESLGQEEGLEGFGAVVEEVRGGACEGQIQEYQVVFVPSGWGRRWARGPHMEEREGQISARGEQPMETGGLAGSSELSFWLLQL